MVQIGRDQRSLTGEGERRVTFRTTRGRVRCNKSQFQQACVPAVGEVGTDKFVIREGKIVAQSFAGKITPKKSA